MDESLRVPLVVAEIVALAAILAFVEDPLPRVALGLVVGLLLAWNSLAPRKAGETARAPAGYDDRRQDHLFRHWVNILLKKIREFHTVCQGISDGGVNVAVGQLRISEIEKEIRELLSQVTDSAMPGEMRKERRARGSAKSRKKKIEAYGEPIDED